MSEDKRADQILAAQQAELQHIRNFQGPYPRQIWYLFFTEMWERFCFYGNRGILSVFMVEILTMNDQEANLKYGAMQAFIYAFTFLGGILADKILGFRKSLFWGGSLMIVGSALLGLAPHDLFYVGMSFMVIGTGFFKPNISTMVGELYKEGDTRRDAGFSLFYSGINVGALLGGGLCVWVGKNYTWNFAFALSGIFMLLGLIVFFFTRRSLGPIGLVPVALKRNRRFPVWEVMVYVGSLLTIPFIIIMVMNTEYTDRFMYTIGPLALGYFLFELRKLAWPEIKRLLAAMIFIVFSVFFWAFYEQGGGSLNLFALKNLHTELAFFHIDPNVVNNSSNPFFIILFSPFLGILWLALARRKWEPNDVIKFGIGFLFLGASFYLFYYTRFFADAHGKTSLNVFTLAYLVMTIGELCISPIGLSLMTRLSPKPLWGMMMGMWFLASAYGQYVAGILGAGMSSSDEKATEAQKLILYTDGFQKVAVYSLIGGVLLVLISPLVKKLMAPEATVDADMA